MRLIALLVVLVLGGLWLARSEGLFQPSATPRATPGQTTRQVQQVVDSASRAERQRLQEALKAGP